VINEGHWHLKNMLVDEHPFPMHTIELQGAKVLVWPEQVESTKDKNVIIVEGRPKSSDDKILSREVVLEKAIDGKEMLKITIKTSGLDWRGGGVSDRCAQPARPVEAHL
jgi:hypothetical protein